jgi:hypothetical protein
MVQLEGQGIILVGTQHEQACNPKQLYDKAIVPIDCITLASITAHGPHLRTMSPTFGPSHPPLIGPPACPYYILH